MSLAVAAPDLRFRELETGLSLREAFAEAGRCLNCARPACREGCPIANDIPGFVGALAAGDIGRASAILAERTNLPAVCGRVCPRELQCEAHCVLARRGKGINIGKLERFVADFMMEMPVVPPLSSVATAGDGGRVAVIGSGPAGLTVAGDLAKRGLAVTVYEAQPEPGGVLMYGIPDYRLPKIVVRREIAKLAELGVVFKTGVMVGADLAPDQLFKAGYDAVFIGTGNALPKTLDLPGHERHQIIPAIYYLQTVALVKAGQVSAGEVPLHGGEQVVVIGGGNVALDAARTAVKISGAQHVTMLFRENRDEMPARRPELARAQAEGVALVERATPVRFEGDDFVRAVVYLDRQGVEQRLPATVVLVAVGQRPAARIVSATHGIAVTERGFIVTKSRPFGMTTRQGVFAGGDVVTGPSTVVRAMKEAKRVAAGMAEYVAAKRLLVAAAT